VRIQCLGCKNLQCKILGDLEGGVPIKVSQLFFTSRALLALRGFQVGPGAGCQSLTGSVRTEQAGSLSDCRRGSESGVPPSLAGCEPTTVAQPGERRARGNGAASGLRARTATRTPPGLLKLEVGRAATC
jgi:hypothetical protein